MNGYYYLFGRIGNDKEFHGGAIKVKDDLSNIEYREYKDTIFSSFIEYKEGFLSYTNHFVMIDYNLSLSENETTSSEVANLSFMHKGSKNIFADNEKIYVSTKTVSDVYSLHGIVFHEFYDADSLLIFDKKNLELIDKKKSNYFFRIIDYDKEEKKFDTIAYGFEKDEYNSYYYASLDTSLNVLENKLVYKYENNIRFFSSQKKHFSAMNFYKDENEIFFYVFCWEDGKNSDRGYQVVKYSIDTKEKKKFFISASGISMVSYMYRNENKFFFQGDSYNFEILVSVDIDELN